MSVLEASKKRMTVPEFLEWAVAQARGRYELVDGEIVAMAPERVRQNLTKANVYRALDDAVRDAALPCMVFTDGVTVVIDEHTAREPDASVQCGVSADLDSMIIEAPLIIVEVSSPSSERDDTGLKLIEYFSVPTIRHYLIVRAEQAVVIHHSRDQGGEIRTRIARDGMIDLDPPGIAVAVDRFLGAAPTPATKTG